MKKPVVMAGLVVLTLAVPVFAQRVGTDLSEVLNKDEIKAFEELKAAGGDRFSSVTATIDQETRLLNLLFHRPLTLDDKPRLRRLSKLGLLFFLPGRTPTLSDESLEFLDGVRMTGLFIWRQPISDDGLKALNLFPMLKDLTLMETRVTDAGLAFLKSTQQPLKKLAISKSEVTDAGLDTIGQLGSLENLSMFQCSKITDDGIRRLSALVGIEKLFLNNNDLLTSAALAHLATMKRITRLELDAIKLEEKDLGSLLVFDNLETLSLAKTGLTDNGVQTLVTLNALKHLNVQETAITDAGLSSLKKIKHLASLGLSKTNITDNGLAQIGALKGLAKLGLSGTQVGDDGLDSLRGLENLEQLNLDDTKITAASVDTIVGFQRLAHLNIQGTGISAEGRKRIEAELPKCKVYPTIKVTAPRRQPRRPRPRLPDNPLRHRLADYRPYAGVYA